MAVAEAVAGTANPVPVDAAAVEALLRRALDDEPPMRTLLKEGI